MVLRVSGFEIFKFNANLGTVQWVLSVFTMVLYKKMFTLSFFWLKITAETPIPHRVMLGVMLESGLSEA